MSRQTVRLPGPRRVTLSAGTAALIESNRPRVAVRDAAQRVEVIERPTLVRQSVPGVQGRPGASAGDAVGPPPISFAFGDASHVVWSAPVSGLIEVVRVDVREAFDQPAVISVGFPLDDDALLPASAVDATIAAAFELAPDLHIAADSQVWLRINSGPGTTCGAGLLVISFKPD